MMDCTNVRLSIELVLQTKDFFFMLLVNYYNSTKLHLKLTSYQRKFFEYILGILLRVPPFLEDDTEDLHEVLRGSNVTLVCPVEGSPEPVYAWSSNNNVQVDGYVVLLTL